MNYSLFFDGGYKDGTASFGFVLYRENQQIDYGYGLLSQGKVLTGLAAEYFSLSYGLDSFISHLDSAAKLKIYGDCTAVIRAIRKQKAVCPPYPELQIVKFKLEQIKQFCKVQIFWVPRTQNKIANDLAKKVRSWQ